MNKFNKDGHLYEDPSRWENFKPSKYLRNKIEIIRSIIPEDVRTIGDVGCGNGIITNTLADTWRVIGLDRSRTALAYVENLAVAASINKLPIKQASFDLVLCSEVIEHLPPQIFKQALKELAGISRKYLLITVPNQEYLAKNHIKCPECNFVFNAAYHLHSFNAQKLQSLFPDFKMIKKFESGKPVRQYNRFLLKIKQKAGNSWARFSEQKYYICPDCGFRFSYRENKNIISFVCDGLNRLVSFRKPYWLGLLMVKK